MADTHPIISKQPENMMLTILTRENNEVNTAWTSKNKNHIAPTNNFTSWWQSQSDKWIHHQSNAPPSSQSRMCSFRKCTEITQKITTTKTRNRDKPLSHIRTRRFYIPNAQTATIYQNPQILHTKFPQNPSIVDQIQPTLHRHPDLTPTKPINKAKTP
jgi:hypothetical protein